MFRRNNAARILVVYCAVSVIVFSACKKEELPQLTTTQISQIDFDTLTGGGTILSEGDSPVSERGVCWSIGQNPTINDSKTSDGFGPGDFTSRISGFNTNTTYFFRAYATNASGTAYGEQVSFEVKPMHPDLKIKEPVTITGTSVTLDVEVIIDKAVVIWSSGVCYSTDPVPTLDSPAALNATQTTVSYKVTIDNLSPASTYYFRPFLVFRLFSTTNFYYVYGDIIHVTTTGFPVIKTGTATDVYDTAAVVSGEVVSGNVFTSRGICISEVSMPTVSDIKITSPGTVGKFSIALNNLLPDKKYFARAFVSGSDYTVYGEEISFTTCSGTLKDISGNVYRTKKIGSQTWMQENLKTDKYNDGTSIPLVNLQANWSTLTAPGSCWYSNNSTGLNGLLYNAYVVNTGKLCPAGWHVPSASEAQALLTLVNNSASVLNDKTGYSAQKGGYRDNTGVFRYGDSYGYWWNSTVISSTVASAWYIDQTRATMSTFSMKNGYSVRCIKD